MSGGPFREMFVELSDAVFAALQGIGEQAVRKAQESSYCNYRPSQFLALINALDNNSIAQERIADRFGWKRLLGTQRAAMSPDIEVIVELNCGHCHRFRVDEHKLTRDSSVLMAMMEQMQKHARGRSCYCTPREEP